MQVYDRHDHVVLFGPVLFPELVDLELLSRHHLVSNLLEVVSLDVKFQLVCEV